MIIDVIRELVDWLADPATGVNALLPHVPRDAGDEAPPAVRICDETRHAWVARGRVDASVLRDGPVLLVHLAGEISAELMPDRQPDGSTVDVAIRYAARGAGTDALMRDAHQTHRCAQRVIAARFPGYTGPFPARNGVTLSVPGALQYVPLFTPLEDSVVVGALLVPIPAHDPWALDIS